MGPDATGRMSLEQGDLDGLGLAGRLQSDTCIAAKGGGWYMPAVNAWPLVLMTVASVNTFAAIFYLFFATVEPIEKKKVSKA